MNWLSTIEPGFLKMEYKWTALKVTVVGVLMAAVDARITTIGLPTIAQF
jgi:hypothetical protein